LSGSKAIQEKKLSEVKTNIFSSVTSGDLVFDLTEKMAEVLSYWFLPLFRTPPTACLYDAQESS
jgi:hypothetical protein